MAKRFPGLGFEKQRKVWAGAFFHKTVWKELPALRESIGGFSHLSDLGVLDAARTNLYVDEVLQNRRAVAKVLHLYNLEVWARKNVN